MTEQQFLQNLEKKLWTSANKLLPSLDAREVGHMLDRKQKAFSDEDTKGIAEMFHKFRKGESYEDVAGEYYAAATEEIAKQEYILTPGRYVGVAEEEDEIKKNLVRLGYEV